MKAINTKLAAFGLAAFVFASCSSSDSPEGGSSIIKNADLDLTNLKISETDATTLASRVINYKNTTANARKNFGTRAGGTGFSGLTKMETIPDMPTTGVTETGKAHATLNGGVWNAKGDDATKTTTVGSI